MLSVWLAPGVGRAGSTPRCCLPQSRAKLLSPEGWPAGPPPRGWCAAKNMRLIRDQAPSRPCSHHAGPLEGTVRNCFRSVPWGTIGEGPIQTQRGKPGKNEKLYGTGVTAPLPTGRSWVPRPPGDAWELRNQTLFLLFSL